MRLAQQLQLEARAVVPIEEIVRAADLRLQPDTFCVHLEKSSKRGLPRARQTAKNHNETSAVSRMSSKTLITELIDNLTNLVMEHAHNRVNHGCLMEIVSWSVSW
jgi:hypothetical protein